MREKKFGKRCLTWALVLMMTLSLLPVSAMAEDGEARFYGKTSRARMLVITPR